MKKITTLDRIINGQYAVVRDVCADESIKRRFLDMGLIKGTVIESVLTSPLGDPCAFLIRGTLIALRKNDIRDIVVEVEQFR